jgi:hypothetical protein
MSGAAKGSREIGKSAQLIKIQKRRQDACATKDCTNYEKGDL